METSIEPSSGLFSGKEEGEKGEEDKDELMVEKSPSTQRTPPLTGKDDLKGEEDDNIQSQVADDLLGSKNKKLERDKENLLSQVRAFSVNVEKFQKPVFPARRAQFKKRSASTEEELLMAVVEKGLDREDVQMFKMAFSQMRGGEEEGRAVTTGIPWAYHPHNILSFLGRVGTPCVLSN